MQSLSEQLTDSYLTLKDAKIVCADEFPELGLHTGRTKKLMAVSVLANTAEQAYQVLESQGTIPLETAPETPPVYTQSQVDAIVTAAVQQAVSELTGSITSIVEAAVQDAIEARSELKETIQADVTPTIEKPLKLALRRNQVNHDVVRELVNAGVSPTSIAKELKIGRATVYRVIAEMQGK